MIDEKTYVAGVRFGLGLRPGEESRIGSSPDSWLMKQIRSPQMASPAFASLASSARNMAYLLKVRQQVKGEDKADKQDALKMVRQDLKDVFIDEMRAKIGLAITTETPFYERLVGFWSNHFAVSVKK